MKSICALLVVLAATTASARQQLRFDDVVRNLRNPDPKARLNAVRLLRDANYPQAIEPMAPLTLDPVEEIQLETIAAEIGFFLEQDIKSKEMVGFVIEKRRSAIAEAAFDLGPFAVWPRAVPDVLVTNLLKAVDDENARVRTEAIYAFGVVARAPLTAEQHQLLLATLDHYDPAVRSGAARVIARLRAAGTGDALIKAVNDSQKEVRFAAMRALGAIHEERALGALTEQLAYYKKGEGAWSALDALARIGAPASTPIFRARLQDKDPYIRRAAAEGIGRAGDAESAAALEGLSTDESAMVRLAAAFALQKLGRDEVARIVDLMNASKVVPQAQEYLVELGSGIVPLLVPRLQEPDQVTRAAIADVLGVIGDPATVPALQAAAQDAGTEAATAARRAIARIRASQTKAPAAGAAPRP